MARVLGVLRLSRASDESTSVVRQRASIQGWADSKGHVIVGWVEDVDVSGGIEPWKRPEFGKWLPSTIGRDVSEIEHRLAWEESRAAEFDIIAAWKLDRLSRRVIHVNVLAEWCDRHGKQLATVEGDIDLSSPMGRILFQLIASFAEGELEAIKARAKSSYTHLMREGRWRGGFVPYGYRPEKQETGEGWKLVPDEYGLNTAETAREIVRRIIDGESANSVCRWLNENRSKTPPPLDAQRLRSGKEPKGAVWRVGNLIKMLHSHTLLGQVEMTEEITLSDGRKEKRTRLVRDKDGLPLQRAEPLISKEDWDRVSAKLAENSNKKAGNRTGGSPLLRVAFCSCGKPLYRYPGRNWSYYRCANKAITGLLCEESKSISAPLLEGTVEEEFLSVAGRLEIIRRVFRPGVDYTHDINEVTRAMKELREDREAGLYSSETGKQEYREEYARMDRKREQLMSLPARPDTWEEIPTGQTYAERWSQLTTASEKSKELRASGLQVIVHTEDIPPVYVGGKRLMEMDRGRMFGRIGRIEIIFPRNFAEKIRQHTATHA
ncbi:recombinase family protein [Streptomyces sp. NPDC059171]|uniref:recombinase family protein n=1 Tax=Streptomyces sp. NPDC059171 TaxID=3346755 RepID=UPI0036B9CC36